MVIEVTNNVVKATYIINNDSCLIGHANKKCGAIFNNQNNERHIHIT